MPKAEELTFRDWGLGIGGWLKRKQEPFVLSLSKHEVFVWGYEASLHRPRPD